MPFAALKRLLKWLAELKPQASEISVSDLLLLSRSAFARAMRRCIT